MAQCTATIATLLAVHVIHIDPGQLWLVVAHLLQCADAQLLHGRPTLLHQVWPDLLHPGAALCLLHFQRKQKLKLDFLSSQNPLVSWLENDILLSKL